MTYDTIAYATDGTTTVTLFQNAYCNNMEEKQFHVTVKSPLNFNDVDAHFMCATPAEKFFKYTIEDLGIKKVFVSNEYLEWVKACEERLWNEEPTQEEEYYDACMASAYGDESLMRRYERKYGIEKEYSPSNPWDAPGMKVSDFI